MKSYKKVVIGIIACFGGFIVGKWSHRFKEKKQTEIGGSKAEKFKMYYNSLNQWLYLKNKGINIEKYFNENDIKKIAIYGMGEMGNRLVEELQGSKTVKIEYVIDKNADLICSNLMVKTMEEKMEEVDMIVVTPIFDFTNIEKKLKQKTKCPIMSIEDIIFEL